MYQLPTRTRIPFVRDVGPMFWMSHEAGEELYFICRYLASWRGDQINSGYPTVAAGLLAVLSLLHIASSALRRRGPCQLSTGIDSVGESLLNSRQENYDRFEEVLVRFLTLLH
ncbi:hypothetical protein DMN91_009498 [Ooceraea biroi]|uniref:Uncharacterized protein n=1 Tax=Ooceraea biroi TaxID=2015173 RepID=A0A3L8DFA5_OOCBI|nr:hypothetical protein DMN91_009498 [Ooceraea biroi]